MLNDENNKLKMDTEKEKSSFSATTNHLNLKKKN